MPYFGEYFGPGEGGGLVTVAAGSRFYPSETALCTDEDIAIEDQTDFVSLAPRSQVLAYGTDGAFDADAPWTLTSDSVDFEAQGVTVGHVIALSRPPASFRAPNGELFGVAAVSGGQVVLRRVRSLAGMGQPPGMVDLTGVTFECRTFGPQIAISTNEAARAFSISHGGCGARSITDAGEDLRRVTALLVLRRAYMTAQKAKDSDFALKLELLSETLSDLTGRLSLQWGVPATPADATPTNRRVRIIR